MTKVNCKAIVAVSQNGVIGKDGDLPWRLSGDLKWFKKITMGHTLIMGRKTWDSLPGALPGRENWVLSRSMQTTSGVRVFDNFESVLQKASGKTLFIMILSNKCQHLCHSIFKRNYVIQMKTKASQDLCKQNNIHPLHFSSDFDQIFWIDF